MSLKKLFTGLCGLSILAALSACSVDVCDVDADCLYYPDAICHAGRCTFKCDTQSDCDHDDYGTYCADYSWAYGLCLPKMTHYECYKDSDCPYYPTDICLDNMCVPNPYVTVCSRTAERCYTSSDCCNSSDTCFSGVCTPRCATSVSCGYPEYACLPSGYEPGAYVCLPNPDYMPIEEDIRCHSDLNCYDNEKCLRGLCYYRCRSSLDCLVGGVQGICDQDTRACFFY